MPATSIEWTHAPGTIGVSWNIFTGCTPKSAGCKNCYARRMANRLRGRFGYPADDPFRVTFHPDRLTEPLRWKKPCTVFVSSMGDLFHDDVMGARFDMGSYWGEIRCLDLIFGLMGVCPDHRFLLLTKRPQNAAEYIRPANEMPLSTVLDDATKAITGESIRVGEWPLSNVGVGVTVESQDYLGRIEQLRRIPAAMRYASCEPLLGALAFPLGDEVDWVIAGGETGPHARPAHPDWFRSLRDQCQAAGTPFFFKRGSDGSRLLDGREWDEFPEWWFNAEQKATEETERDG